jgi:dipeptidyl aminopeptidase/acylaminoacyl peptidase
MFGPADLSVFGFLSQSENGEVAFGVTQDGDPRLIAASPVTYITSEDPPFLILQGNMDTIVPPDQSQEFYDRLTAAGVEATLVMVQNAGHGFAPVGGAISPTRHQLTQMIVDFFTQHLK